MSPSKRNNRVDFIGIIVKFMRRNVGAYRKKTTDGDEKRKTALENRTTRFVFHQKSPRKFNDRMILRLVTPLESPSFHLRVIFFQQKYNTYLKKCQQILSLSFNERKR